MSSAPRKNPSLATPSHLHAQNPPRIGIPAPYRVYNQHNFLAGFVADIQSSSHSIIIQSAFIGLSRLQQLYDPLAKAVKRGVCVCVFVQKPRTLDIPPDALAADAAAQLKNFHAVVEMLQALGAHVNVRARTHEKLAAFDDVVLWDGSMNILSHYDTSERMTRWDSSAETLATIHEQGLNACAICARNSPLSASCSQTLDDWLKQIGHIVRDCRRKARLTQRQLAERINVSHTLIGAVERGERQVGLETLRELCLAIGIDIQLGPRRAL